MKPILQLSITGQNVLAATIAECCARHFGVIRKPLEGCDIMWACYDTPIVGGRPQADKVLQWVADDINALIAENVSKPWPLVLISSQMPVGTIAKFETGFPGWSFACSPENIRVKTAVADFENQARVIIGRRDQRHDQLLADLFAPFTKRPIFTDPETAEMAKHVLNTYLGMSIAFANEMARLCKAAGADDKVVTEALRSDRRISPNAPLLAGGPFATGHLERDIYVLNELAKQHGISVPIIEHILESNSK